MREDNPATPRERAPSVAAPEPSPQTPTSEYDIVLRPFVALMEKELRANSHKGDRAAWLNLTRDGSMFEVYDHSAKLSAALRANDAALIREHAADVANAAMMALDAWGLLVEPEPEPPAHGLGSWPSSSRAKTRRGVGGRR